MQERHGAADVTASKLGSPDAEVGVDHPLHMGEGGRKPAWELFLLHNPLAKEARVRLSNCPPGKTRRGQVSNKVFSELTHVFRTFDSL